MQNQKTIRCNITENELKLILTLRKLKWGNLTIKVQEGVPQNILQFDQRIDLKRDDFGKLVDEELSAIMKETKTKPSEEGDNGKSNNIS